MFVVHSSPSSPSEGSMEQLLRRLQAASSSDFVGFKGILSTKEEVDKVAEALGRSSANGLRLRGCQIGDQGAIAIANVLSGKSRLQVLELPSNGIQRAGAEALRQALQDPMCSLQALDLSGKDISHKTRSMQAGSRLVPLLGSEGGSFTGCQVQLHGSAALLLHFMICHSKRGPSPQAWKCRIQQLATLQSLVVHLLISANRKSKLQRRQ